MASHNTSNNHSWLLIFFCWLVATLSTLGSLFFSEVMGLVPCELCWYQRIFLFPLVPLLLVGLFPLDLKVVRYALPLVIIGLLFTIYHGLLMMGIIPEAMQPCSQGVSCSDKGMILFGWLPIPLLSLIAFSTMLGLLLIARKRITQ